MTMISFYIYILYTIILIKYLQKMYMHISM